MARMLSGADVAKAIDGRTAALVRDVRASGATPTLAVVRVGGPMDALQYERSIAACCRRVGIEARTVAFPLDAGQGALAESVAELSDDAGVHGVLVLQPLPERVDASSVTAGLDPRKDVDGATAASFAGVYANRPYGWPPAVASACMELLGHYGIACERKRAAIIGQGATVGLPISLMLLSANATPTLCHIGSVDIPSLSRAADIVVAATGCARAFGAEYFSPGQVVLDVGAGWSESEQRVRGDVVFEEVEPIVGAIAPVPGGVGVVTASVVASRVALVARDSLLSAEPFASDAVRFARKRV